MKSKHSKQQIEKAIRYWTNQLDLISESDDNIEVQVIMSREEMTKLLPDIIDLVIKTYVPIGGYYGSTDIKKLLLTTKMLKIVRNEEGKIASCAIYRDVEDSSKLQAYANDGTRFGKSGVKAIIHSDVSPYDNWVWAEVSGKVELYFKKFGGFPLPNEFVSEVLDKPASKIQLMPDGFHYKRMIGTSDNNVEKVIFGFKNREIAEKVTADVNYEMRKTEFNIASIGEGQEDDKPNELKYASSFVNQLSDLYDEENMVQLTPGLSSELDASIEILNKYQNDAAWISRTLDLARYLRSNVSTVTFFTSKI